MFHNRTVIRTGAGLYAGEGALDDLAWSLQVQTDLGDGSTLSTGYQGSHG
jgi:hypothetical protein